MMQMMTARVIMLSFAVGLLPAVARADPPAITETPAPEPEGAAMRRIGWFTVGGGALVLVASGVMYGVAFHERNELNEHYTPSVSRAFERDLTTAKVLTMAGLLALGTGATLVLLAPSKDQQVRVTAGLGQVAIGGTF